MHVTIEADWDFDTQMTVLAADRTFEFKGLTKGIYTVSPGVSAHQSPSESTGGVLIDHDRSDLVIPMEPVLPRR
jgi:hypothetical protein